MGFLRWQAPIVAAVLVLAGGARALMAVFGGDRAPAAASAPAQEQAARPPVPPPPPSSSQDAQDAQQRVRELEQKLAEAGAARKKAEEEARRNAPPSSEPDEEEPEASEPVEGGIPGGVVGGVPGGVPAPAPPAAVRVGGRLKAPLKLKDVKPAYPAIARQAHVQGVVILECTISPQGRVTDVKVLRGIPLLDQAAVDAVKQWVYAPTLLDGAPVAVVMTVTVNFKPEPVAEAAGDEPSGGTSVAGENTNPGAPLGAASLAGTTWKEVCAGGNPPVVWMKFRSDGKIEYRYEAHGSFVYSGADSWRVEGSELVVSFTNGYSIERYPLGSGAGNVLKASYTKTRTTCRDTLHLERVTAP